MAMDIGQIVRMRDVRFDPDLFQNYMTGTVLDELLCSYKGLPKGGELYGHRRSRSGEDHHHSRPAV